MSRFLRWVVLGLVLFAVACSPAVGEHHDPSGGGTGAGDDLVFGTADLSQFQQDGGYAVSRVIPADGPATRGGFLLDLWQDVGSADVNIEIRGVHADGTTTPWVAADVTWREAPHVVGRADLGETVTATQIRLPAAQVKLIQNMIYDAVTPAEIHADDSQSGTTGTTSQGLSSELVGLVQPRSAWGARPAKCSTADANKYRMAIHHTFTAPSSAGGYEARIRSIQAYHQDTRGWCDIGYHFLVTEDGRVWEGRPVNVLGAHVSGNNTGNIGISWVGCFQKGACDGISSSNVPTDAAIEGAGHVMNALAKMFGITTDAAHIKGHRDHPGANTECPGDGLESRIPDLIGMAGGSDPTPPPGPSEPAGRALGVVWDLSQTSSPSVSGNVRIAGATIAVQGGPTTTARAGDAFWSIDLAPGDYTVSVSAPGYQTSTESVHVDSSSDTWASVGLVPDGSGAGTGGSGGASGSGGAGGSGGSAGTGSGGSGGSAGSGSGGTGSGGSAGTGSAGSGGSSTQYTAVVQAALDRAQAGVGFSYWWGHGRFLMQGPSSSDAGSCSGSCPSCSHSGSYGGDCSGYVAKIWQVPSSNTDFSSDSHPYSTLDFYSDTSLWTTVSRGAVKAADAFVYRSGSSGHIFLYKEGDGWGSMYAYECKGCSYGCVAGYRTASSAYHAIRRTGY